MNRTRKHSFVRRHSLSIVSSAILLCWIVLYLHSNPDTHWGSFFGNAIADWTGLVVTVLATKFMYEKGSAESRKPPHHLLAPIWEQLQEHSLTIFLSSLVQAGLPCSPSPSQIQNGGKSSATSSRSGPKFSAS